jgi:pimeloyl-ACP methyl ester carboxylesterase
MNNGLKTSRSLGSYRASEVCWFYYSRAWHFDQSRRGLIFCHGAGASADSGMAVGVSNKLPALAAAGYPIAICDLGAAAYSGQAWANADSMSAMDAAWTFLKSQMNVKTDKVYLWGDSMGTCTSMAWTRVNLATVAALGVTVPVLDPNDIYQNNKGTGLRAGMQTAWGVTYPTPLPSVATWAPVSMGGSDLAGLQIKLWTSTDDPVASNTAAASLWGGCGATVTIQDFGAHGHNASFVDPLQMVQFFDDNGGRS